MYNYIVFFHKSLKKIIMFFCSYYDDLYFYFADEKGIRAYNTNNMSNIMFFDSKEEAEKYYNDMVVFE